MSAVWAVFLRDMRVSVRQGVATTPAFFLLVVFLAPLGTGAPVRAEGAGLVWLAALLALLLSLHRLFEDDRQDGTEDVLRLAPLPLPLLVGAKCAAHWCLTGAPLAALAPVAGMLLNLPEDLWATLFLAFLLATPTLTLIGALGAALTAGLTRGSTLAALLVLPLSVPVLVFGALAAQKPVSDFASAPETGILALFLALALATAPFASAAALRSARA